MTPLTEQQLADYEAAIAAYHRHPQIGFACRSAHPAAVAAGALAAEVRRLNARVAELEEDGNLLSALQAAGVDNWEGYDDAIEHL